jgi:hypothetical protein
MIKFLLLSLSFIGLANAESLYLGNNNVSCGRYTLNSQSNINDVTNYCNVLESRKAKNGGNVLKIKTATNGVIRCKFISGQLEKCHTDD